MPKYFVYDDPDMAAHVDKMLGYAKDAEDNETEVRDCQERPKEYEIHNRLKPFKPMSKDDLEHRYTLSQGGGKDKFQVAKHRAAQKKCVEKYEKMKADRDAGGNFHLTAAQHAKVAKVVQAEEVKKQKDMGYLQRITAAISLSKKARMERADAKLLKKSIEKVIKAAESD